MYISAHPQPETAFYPLQLQHLHQEVRAGMSTNRKVLDYVLSTVSYRTALEIGNGEPETRQSILQHLSKTGSKGVVYVGMYRDEEVVKRFKETHEEEKKHGLFHVPSLFLTREIFSLEERGCGFDLICVTCHDYSLLSMSERHLRKFLEKAFKHSAKLVVHTPLQWEDSGGSYDSSPSDFPRKPNAKIFPLSTYQRMAKDFGKKVTVHEDTPFLREGALVRVSYLLFT